MDAFVLGYPRGMSGGGHFPVWKRATIATEPDIDLDGLPRFYIDTATREGMSGSPVYAQEVGYWLPEGETDKSKASIGKGRQIAAMPAGISSLSAGISKEIPAIWAKHYYIQRSLMMNPSI
jgi:hypothetical protein